MECNDCNTCKHIKKEFPIEEMLKCLDEIVCKLKTTHQNNLNSLLDLDIAVSAVHKEFEEKVNKFCRNKCGIDYPEFEKFRKECK